MKGFALDETGDLVIQNGEIQMAYGNDLILQTIKSILLTKKGEWFLDWEQGIDRDLIMGKKRVDDGTIQAVIQDGLSQIDENLIVDTLTCTYDKSIRKLFVFCVVKNKKTDETLTIEDAI